MAANLLVLTLHCVIINSFHWSSSFFHWVSIDDPACLFPFSTICMILFMSIKSAPLAFFFFKKDNKIPKCCFFLHLETFWEAMKQSLGSTYDFSFHIQHRKLIGTYCSPSYVLVADYGITIVKSLGINILDSWIKIFHVDLNFWYCHKFSWGSSS